MRTQCVCIVGIWHIVAGSASGFNDTASKIEIVDGVKRRLLPLPLSLFIVVVIFILVRLIPLAYISLCLSPNTMQLWPARFRHNLSAVGRFEHASPHMKSINQSYLPLFHRFLQPAAAAKHLSPDTTYRTSKSAS